MYNGPHTTEASSLYSVREKIVTQRSSIVIVYKKSLNLRHNPTCFDDANKSF